MAGRTVGIKTKLFFSTCVTFVGLVALATVSIVGIRFVQGKLALLTERSTPYQLKTIELQRALQEHTANLLKVAVASTPADLAAGKGDTDASIAEVVRLTADLHLLTNAKAGTEHDAAALAGITREMLSTTAARLQAQDAVRAANTTLSARLQEIDGRLRDLGRAMTALQKESVRQLSTASGKTSEITEKLMSLTLARDAVKDMSFTVIEIQKAETRKALLIARSKLETATSEFAKNRLVAGNDPLIREVADAVAEAKKLVTAPQGLLDLKAALLAKTGAGEPPPGYDQAVQAINTRLGAAMVGVEQQVTTANDRYAQETKSHAASLRGSAGATDIAALNADLISLGSDITTQSRALFAARATKDLDGIAGEVGKVFAGAEAVRARLIKALEGNRGGELKLVREVGDALASVNRVLFDKDGALTKLHEVLRVEQTAAKLNDRLKTLVGAQREQGNKGMSVAHIEQEEAVKSVNRVVQQQVATTVVVGVGVLVLAIVVSLLLARSITRQLGGEPSYAVEVVKRIAAGDLTRPVVTRPHDTISLLAGMKNMQDTLGNVIGTIRESTERVGVAASEIAIGTTDLAQRTEEQASSLEETASNMVELTSTMKQNADNAKRANTLAASTSDVAAKSGQAVGEVVAIMGAISVSSKKIADIIGTIDGLAFQTNILALNAAVEAARAGEEGRGFAVVAAEVRTLAQRSAAAAREMNEFITDSLAKVDSGLSLVDEAGKTMAEVVASVERVTAIMLEITAASLEQSEGIGQVNKAIEQMDVVTQQNAASVEQSAAAAESMEDEARELRAAVALFKVDDRGAGLSTPGAAMEEADGGAAMLTPALAGRAA